MIRKYIYIYATTGRWGIEELYKISKRFIEEFHSKTACRVKQELYAHILLNNLSRFLEFEAQDLVPPAQRKGKKIKKASGFTNVFNPLSIMKINFKNCLLVVGRNLASLILKGSILLDEWLVRIIKSVARIRQRIRPKRHYPRISHKTTVRWTTSIRNTVEKT